MLGELLAVAIAQHALHLVGQLVCVGAEEAVHEAEVLGRRGPCAVPQTSPAEHEAQHSPQGGTLVAGGLADPTAASGTRRMLAA